jgi:hypothetical protein
MGFCSTLNATVLGLAATIYLIIGLVFIAASAATFFTPYGEIFTPIYAGFGIGIGVLIFLVSVIGFLAACQKGKCWLGLYMSFDLLIIVLIIIAVILMFRYEDVLRLASDAGVDGAVTGGLAALTEYETNLIKDVVTNAFTACEGNTTVADATTGSFNFKCDDSYFNLLGESVNTCVSNGVNGTVGSIMYTCYMSDKWVQTDSDGDRVNLTQPATTENVLPVLQTPKGLYCACSSTIMNDFILKYIGVTKYVGIGIGVFFILIFLSCCYLCCCAPKPQEKEERVEFTGGYAGQPQVATQGGYNTKKKGGYNADAAYMVAP